MNEHEITRILNENERLMHRPSIRSVLDLLDNPTQETRWVEGFLDQTTLEVTEEEQRFIDEWLETKIRTREFYFLQRRTQQCMSIETEALWCSKSCELAPNVDRDLWSNVTPLGYEIYTHEHVAGFK